MYEDILSMQDQLNEVFYESEDLIEEDYYDEDVATEASVKGATKKAFAFVANIIRRVIDAITRWIKNRSINKLVSFLKNKVAKYKDDDQRKDDQGNPLYYDSDDNDTTTSTRTVGSGTVNNLQTSSQRDIWRKLKKSMNGSTGNTNVTQTWVVFTKMINKFKSADQLVTLQAILRQIKSTPVDKFGKELSGIKATKGFGGNTVIDSISSSGNGILKLFPILSDLTGVKDTDGENVFMDLSKGQCDIIGKCLKTFMACISHFMLKTMRYYQSKEDQWTMTSNQKQIVAAIKNCQKIVYDIIKAANVAISGVNTDNFEEADNESVEVDMNDMMLDMMITNESLTEALNEMDTTEDFDFEF